MMTRLLRTNEAVARMALTLIILLHLPAGAAFGQTPFGSTQNPIAGARVFGSKGCVKCHAINGLGGTIAPDLGRMGQHRSFYALIASMWNHLPRMGEAMQEHGIERPQMDAQQAGDLVAFLFTLDYFDPPGDIEVGQRLFSEKKCIVCHQVGLTGGVIGPSLDFLSQFGSPILVAAAMWNHGPAMAEAMRERGISRPNFEGSELTDLIAYLESVSPQPLQGPLYVLPGRAEEGRVVFTEKRCVRCHSVNGEGGRVGPDLAQRGSNLTLTEFAAAMWNKAPAMQQVMSKYGIQVPQLGAGEVADLVAYLYSVQYFAESGDAQRGRRLAQDKGCFVCHVGGQGGDAAMDLSQLKGLDSSATLISSLWNHSVLMTGDPDSWHEEWPTFTASEIADLAAFLRDIAGSYR